MSTEAPASRVLVRVEGVLGRLTLDRPEVLNALDIGMVRALTEALRAWRDNGDVRVVLIEGAGERGFCAGGDVRVLREEIVAGRPEAVREFFREEYALNALIGEYPKPIVAFADGITMGGGIGLAGHAAIRVVTERSRLAMPETRIGFTPDVGGTYLLGKAPGRLGEYLGLTGGTMDGADAIYAGFADNFVPSERLDAVRTALAAGDDPHAAVQAQSAVAPEPAIASIRSWVDEVFAVETVPELFAALRTREEPDAADTLATLESLSPTALAVTLDAVREARGVGLREALEGEYRRVLWFVHEHPDLVEGIRAQLVDKDRNPQWQPATVAELDPAASHPARHFTPTTPLFP